MSEIDFLCIGHVCHDKTPDGFILGGTTSYAGIVSSRLGMKAGILTSFGPDFLFEERLKGHGISVITQPSLETTTFENIYSDAGRIQYMSHRADTISPSSLPRDLSQLKAIQLCLIADEVDNQLLKILPEGILVGATIQGWLRSFGTDNRVHTKMPNLNLFEKVDIAIMSDDDIRDVPKLLPQLIERLPIVVVTRGANGADVFQDGQKHFFPSIPTIEVDPTGAGDVFSTAFLISYCHNPDILKACSFAHAAASISIEGTGVQSIPDREAVFERQESYLKDF